MNWKKAIGYGVGIYVIIFIYWSLLVAFDQGETALAWFGSFVLLAVVAHLAAAKLCTENWREIITYSAIWLAVTAVLDAVVTTKFTGWEFYSSWEVYIAYAILLLVPLSVICCEGKCCNTNSGASTEAHDHKNHDDHHSSEEHKRD